MPGRENFRDVHHDAMMTNISIAHFQDTDAFVAGRFFPMMSVQKASDVFTTYPQGYFNRIHESDRSEETEANSITYATGEDNYSCKQSALRVFISDEKRANVDSQRRLDEEAIRIVTDSILRTKEKLFVDTFLSSGKWAKDLTGTAGTAGANEFVQWDNDSADPVADVSKQRVEIALRTGGRKPNRAIMTLDVWEKLKLNADIIDRVKYSGGIGNNNPAQVTMQAVSALFELDDILIMSTIQNAADDGIEDATTGLPSVDNEFMASKKFLMGYVPSSAGLMTPVAGLTFLWNNFVQHGANGGPRVRRYRKSEIQGEYIEVAMAMDQKLVSKEMCTLFDDVIA